MAEKLDESIDENNVEIGPLKLCIGNEKSLVLLTYTTKRGSDCQICVYKCLTVPAASPVCLMPTPEIKKGPLFYGCTITPSTVINLDRFECNHGKSKLAVSYYQNEDDVGGSAHNEMVFKEHKRNGNHVAKLEELLRQGPYKDIHTFDVDIAPHQCIPEGPSRIVIFPTHICVVKRNKLKKEKNRNNKGVQIATIKREMRQLPMVVRLRKLDNFSPLPFGLRFEVSGQSYFFCCNEGGDDMNNLINTFRHMGRGPLLPNPSMPKHNKLRRVLSEPHSNPVKPHAKLKRQLSAPVNFRYEEEHRVLHCEEVINSPTNKEPPPLPDRQPSSTTPPPLPPKIGPSHDTTSEPAPATNEGGTCNHYANEWVARRCEEDLTGGIKLMVGVFAAKPQLGQTWIMYVAIYPQGMHLQDVKESFPGPSKDIVCPPRAFQVVQHLSINVELPDGWNTDEVVKDIRIENLKELTDRSPYIHDICIKHNNTDQKRFHGRIFIRQGLSETLTLNIITNFSLYEAVGQRRADEPLYDLVPAIRPPGVRKQQGLLQEFSKRLEFCRKMDVPNFFGNDYRLLAEKIGLDYQAIVAIETRCQRSPNLAETPTELVLREWERGKSTVPFSQKALVGILHDMGRPDVIQDLALQVPKLKDFGVEVMTANTIHVKWELDTQDVTDCTIEIRPAGGNNWTTAGCVQNNDNRTFQLDKLQPETEYNIRIQPSFQRVDGQWTEIKVKTAAVSSEEGSEGEDNSDSVNVTQEERGEDD